MMSQFLNTVNEAHEVHHTYQIFQFLIGLSAACLDT